MDTPTSQTEKFVTALGKNRHLVSLLDTTVGTRGRYSTDAGIYRVVPQLVAFPRSKEDVLALLAAARQVGMPVTNRGGGTSCAGNAIGPGLVIDFTRHMNRVLSIDPNACQAVVQPGCIESTLQEAAKQYGLRFGPDPSSQNRCSIGGMVGNNACGPHATAWGRTAVNVLELECVDGRGRHFRATTNNLGDLPELQDLVDSHLATIRTEFGKFSRQLSGYQMDQALPENGRNLAALLVGTEGTLVTVLEITVKLVPLPKAPVLVALGYENMIAAADDVPHLLAHQPLSMEGLDRHLVNVVLANKGSGSVPDLPRGEGWLICEVSGMDVADSLTRARALVADSQSLNSAVYPPGADAAALWRVRADGAGLGGRTPIRADGSGADQAWPGFEDAAVPPANLGAYLRDFTACMEKYGISGLLYGHFGDGCVHVRLDFPLQDGAGVAHTRAFLEDAARTVARHGGSMSGEHGDGRSRSELLKYMYSPTALDLFAAVKHIFDPANLMNPGVIVDPTPLDENIRRHLAQEYPAQRGFAFTADKGNFTTALHRCTGVAKCRATVPGTFMCPSFAATGEEKDVTRGRARILEEAVNGTLVEGLAAPEVMEALDLCLACKACSSDCPAGVDMAKYRSETYFRAYRGRLRPRTHYLLGQLPRWLKATQSIPGGAALVNIFMQIPPVRRRVFAAAGMDPRRQMPRLATERFTTWATEMGLDQAMSVPLADADSVAPTASTTPVRYVVLWADSFSENLDSKGAADTAKLLEKAGYHVLVAPAVCCALTWITTGQLRGARARLNKLLETLAPFALAGIPIVGVEPSCTAVLRDDLLDLLPADPRAQAVAGGTYTLAELLFQDGWEPPNLAGKRVVAQPHCHHYSVMGWRADRQLLDAAGVDLVELSGCCGLAGNFGMERGHYDISVKVAENSLLPGLADNPNAIFLADGFSCRTQAAQLAGRRGVHLATLLLDEDVAPGSASL
ncbi:MAG: FAD-binding and (Fe-S)-binding domain-containing protein [Actinomycetaceae bacterium]|nr:FAD-binding and (Fe-S)-binding domain-containing protein [Actinomycetaceae bacterium]